ncbi:MAG: pitrilysin family protein [Planctomycetota bacterium]
MTSRFLSTNRLPGGPSLGNAYFEHEYANGLRLLVEPMQGVQSAAFTFLVPAGVIWDPPEGHGTANLLSSFVTRGAGTRDSRELATALDNLGVQRSESSEIFHTSFTAATLANNLLPALELTADVIRRPHLTDEQFAYCQEASLQELEAVEDDPGQKTFIELRERSLPEPLGWPILGRIEDLENLTPETARRFHQNRFRPNGSILGVAGAVDFAQVRDHVGKLFDDWRPAPEQPLVPGTHRVGYEHIVSDKIQTHIGIAYPAVSANDPDFFNAPGAVGVLSGGMSARLFTEVREKRGLCYSVGASFMALKHLGRILAYASSTNERAGETLKVLIDELVRLKEGIGVDEVRRVQAGLKSSLIMQEESTSARASVLARGWFNLGRVRSVEEVAREIDRLTPESILGFVDRYPPRDLTTVTLGPQPLENHS